MQTIAENPTNVPKLLLVDASGNLKTAEQVNLLPSSKGKTTIIESVNVTAGLSTIHTVTAGKVFYLCYAHLSFVATQAGTRATLIIAGETVIRLTAGITATYNTQVIGTQTVSPATPIPIAAGETLQASSSFAGMEVDASIIGWEEDV